MKVPSILILLLLAPCVQAQWIVSDPGHTAQTIAATLQDAAEHAEVLQEWQQQYEQLTRQIETMTDQLNVQTTIKEWTGNPGTVLLPSLDVLGVEDFMDDLNHGIPWTTIIDEASGTESLNETHGGLYVQVKTETVTGESVTVKDDTLKPYAVVDDQYTNYVTASDEIDARLQELQENQALTLEELKSATTDAEVQKLSAIVNAQNGQIALLISEREKQYQQYAALKALNENQAEKEKTVSVQAQLKDQHDAYRSLSDYLKSITTTTEP
jgi:hypothetical protein